MHLPRRHLRGYHAWPSSTPVMDAIRAIVGVASVVVGAHALLFLTLAWLGGDRAAAADCAMLLVAVGLANGFVDGLRHWFRHHG